MAATSNANTVAIISGGVTYNFWDGSGAQTDYTGANTPWTTAAGSCYALANNTTAGPVWVPQAAPATMIYSGGPPFAIGRQPVMRSFDTITETIGIQLNATTKDNAIFLLRQLRQILNTALYTVPAVLSVKGGTTTGYTEIYSADVQESTLYLIEPTGNWRATMTWTRHPHFARLSSGETLINAVSIKNTGTGSPDNIEALGTGAGDLLYDMQPLNVSLTPPAAGLFSQVMMAVCASRTYTTSGAGAFDSTGSNTYLVPHTLTSCLTIHNLKPRILVRTSAISANARLAFQVALVGSFNNVYVSPWAYPVKTGATGLITDLGTYPVDIFRQRISGFTTPSVFISVVIGSTDGSAATMTMTYTELLLYSTFFKTTYKPSAATANAPLQVNSFPEQTNAVCLPYQVTSVATRNGANADNMFDPYGTLPLYSPNSSLYVAWLDGLGVHTTTAASTLTVTHAPLFQTVRGAT